MAIIARYIAVLMGSSSLNTVRNAYGRTQGAVWSRLVMTVFVSTSVVVIIGSAVVLIAAINVAGRGVTVEGFEDVRESPVALFDTAVVVIIQIRRRAAATAVVARDFPERQALDSSFLLREGLDGACIAQQERFVALVVGPDQDGNSQGGVHTERPHLVQRADRRSLNDRSKLTRRDGCAEVKRHDVDDAHLYLELNRTLSSIYFR